MAPETWLGKHITEKADIFALGMLLLELHTRAEPWATPQTTVLSVDVSAAADADGATNGAERAAFLSPVQIGTDYYGSVV